MVRENRIKEVRFTQQQLTAASSGLSVYTEHPINGEILQVEHKFNQNGSLAITPSGLSGQEIWRRNASSGTNFQVGYPAYFTESTTGSIANAEHRPFIVNDVLQLTTGSLVSGTAATLDVTVKYR